MSVSRVVMITEQCEERDAEVDRCIRPKDHAGPCHFMAPHTRTPAAAQPQWLVVGPDGRELLISFWGGLGADPEVSPRLDATRWGAPLPIRRVGA